MFLFSVFIDEMSKRKMSLQSLIMLLYSVSVINFVSLSRSSQYSVSAHSFREILVFTMNSFLLTEYWASVRFAPIDVPEHGDAGLHCLQKSLRLFFPFQGRDLSTYLPASFFRSLGTWRYCWISVNGY